ncbi:MAG: hypothetical protein WA485_02105 [Candidatus Sulfotelmatobacter sp.]
MSVDRHPKFALVPYSPAGNSANGRIHSVRDQVCGFCELPISAPQPPVLLKSGHSVHLECYLTMKKSPAGHRPN